MRSKLLTPTFSAFFLTLAGSGLLGAGVFVQGNLQAEEAILIKNKPLSKWLKQIKSSNRGLQVRAARALSEAPVTAHPKIAEALIPILESTRANDRFVAAQVLGKCGPVARAAVPKLLPLLKGTQYERNRAAAAKALGLILKDAQPSEEIETVVAALTAKFNEEYDKYSDVRRESVRALGMIGPAAKSCVPKLVRALKDYRQYSSEHDMVRQQAAWTCSRMGPHAAPHMDLLISMMHSEGHRAPEILAAIGNIGAIHKNVVPNIVDKMEQCGNNHLACRLAAMKALEQFGSKAAPAVPFLKSYLSQAIQGRGPVAPMISACAVLGKVGPAAKTTVPLLQRLATHKFHPHAQISQADHAKLHAAATKALAALSNQGILTNTKNENETETTKKPRKRLKGK